MQAEQWRSCTKVFDAAVELSATERAAFLAQECQGNEALRQKVELLLKYHEKSDGFIDSPAFETLPELLLGNADALVGECLGHYRIDAVVGVGGMGVVYLAHDEQLGRKVALKLLPQSFVRNDVQLERLKREARTASALNHPNIVTIHEIGEADGIHYIATEFIEGITLRERLTREPISPNESVEIALQIANALSVAHGAGIVHCDVKPENIMLRPDGYVKVLDFGIAKFTQQEDKSVGVEGTKRYMSPEQVRGEELDARSDIWSLGVTLREMTTAPVPPELERLISRALSEERDARYGSATELRADLHRVQPKLEASARSRWRIAAAVIAALAGAALVYVKVFLPSPPPLPHEKSIAVLPFENQSRDPDNAYLADGIQDQILTRLSKIADLKVISRTSTEHYKSAHKNLPEIARQLGVAHILEGSIQKSGDAVRVNVQLIKAANDSHLWAETFDRKLTDIFSVESEVAKAIAEHLRVHLTGQEEQIIVAKPTDNIEAYDAYLRGLAYSLKPGSTVLTHAVNAQKYLKEAVRLDPKFALSWALLSLVDSIGYAALTLQPTDSLREEARQAAETALSLHPNLGEALHAKGYYHYACLKDYDTAVGYFEQARQFLPNSSQIPESLAYVARRRGQWDRSESYFNEAERLDPRNVSLLVQHANSYSALRRFPEALRKLDQVLNITPDDVVTLVAKAGIAQAEGDLPRAAELLAQLQRRPIDDPDVLGTQAYQAVLERRLGEIIPRLKEVLAKPDPALGYFNGELRLSLGWAQQLAGDHAAAEESWRQARRELETFVAQQPENYRLIGDLAVANIFLGDKAAALTLAERAVSVIPIETDALLGPYPLEILARVAAQAGEHDRAIAILEKLLSIPYHGALTPALLRLDPIFDPLRNDPRFQKLVTSPVSEPAS